jgi:DNA-directed RNA polymerase specialized sigma24 family protein
VGDPRTDQREEFERLAESLSPALRRYLRRRFHALGAEHDDLIQDTLADLLAYLERREGAVPSDQEVTALAFAILKRRAADRYRDAARRAAAGLPEELPAEDADVEKGARYRQLLAAVLLLLTDLDDESQRLLLREQLLPGDAPEVLSAAQRKRLSRLREELRRRLRSRFGTSPEDFLKG